MKIVLASLCVLTVLAQGAFCAGTSIKPFMRRHFEEWTRQNLHHAKEEWLLFGEEMISQVLSQAGHEFCVGQDIDWQSAIKMTKERGKEIDIEGETLCALIRNHIEHVFEPLTTTLDGCGAASRSGPVGRSIVAALKAVVKHVCSINGEQIFEMANTCSFHGILRAPECHRFKKAADSIKPGNTTRTFVEEVCDVLPLGRDCFLDAINQECQLEFTKKAWEDLLNSIMTPCEKL